MTPTPQTDQPSTEPIEAGDEPTGVPPLLKASEGQSLGRFIDGEIE